MYNYNLITPPSYDTRRYFNLCSEADISRLNLPQVTSIVTSVSVREYLFNQWSKLQIFLACYPRPWIGHSLAALQFVTYFRFYG